MASNALTTVVVHNRLEETPALIGEVEEQFLGCQTHGWSRDKQIYIVVYGGD